MVNDRSLAQTRDTSGRWLIPSLRFLALQRLPEDDQRFGPILESLQQQLDDDHLEIPTRQRLFLMRELTQLRSTIDFPTLEAEALAIQTLEAGEIDRQQLGLMPGRLDGIWQQTTELAVALYSESWLRARFQEWLSGEALPRGTQLTVLSPSQTLGTANEEEIRLVVPLFSAHPQWRLLLEVEEGLGLEDVALQRVAFYRLIAFLGIAAIALFAWVIGRRIQTQVELARLKNDLLSTVSHELKTPLSSMRLLVDTLLDSEEHDPARVREYLELIASENHRLSRLVENFLTFSRLEQGRYALNLETCAPKALTELAVAALGDAFVGEASVGEASVGEASVGPEDHFAVHIDADLSMVEADRDAMVIVLLNLLDNARKYSGEEIWIELTVREQEGWIEWRVRDRGVGMSQTQVRQAFERFYQGDQRLSRRASGCGLGLSIVRRLVEAQGGEIDVESRQGEGSVFTVRLPAMSGVGEAT